MDNVLYLYISTSKKSAIQFVCPNFPDLQFEIDFSDLKNSSKTPEEIAIEVMDAIYIASKPSDTFNFDVDEYIQKY